MTRDDYEKAIKGLANKPIMGTHTIGVLRIDVGPRRWLIKDGHGNVFQGEVGSGPVTRQRIDRVLMRWLNSSNIQ